MGEAASAFPGFLYSTLDPYLIILMVKHGAIEYIFGSLVKLDLGLNPSLSDHW